MSHYSNSMKWNQVLSRWIKGYYPKFSNINDEFIWRTSPYYENSIYKEEFINVSGLDKNSNYSAFSSKFTKNIKYVVAFSNLSNDTMLVCPVPIKSKNYSSIYSFNKNASDTQKKAFWKKVAQIAIIEQNKHGIVWISTHGYGVPWFHVRISRKPKYYGTSKLKDI